MRVLKILFLSLTCFTCSVFAGNFLNEEAKEVQQIILESFVNSIYVDGTEGGAECRWIPNEDVIIYDKGNVEIYNTSDLKEEYSKENFLNESTSYELTSVKVDGSNACAVVEIYNGTSHAYTNFITLHKFDKKWEIITKVFYSH